MSLKKSSTVARALLAGVAVAALTLAACGERTPTQGACPAVTPPGGDQYRTGVGDKLRVTVLGQNELSGELEVDAGGKIVVPLVGEVAAAGQSLREIESEIRNRLARDIVRDPKVTVQVTVFRPISVLGEVKLPGRYPYSAGMNVRSAAALAGGYDRRASQSTGIVLRPGSPACEGKADTLLLPGDTVEIPKR